MHDGMPYGRNQGQGQRHLTEVDRQSPTGLIFFYKLTHHEHKTYMPKIGVETACHGQQKLSLHGWQPNVLSLYFAVTSTPRLAP